MQISVSGKGVDVGDSLRAHMEKGLDEQVNKYIDRVTSVQAVVSKDAHRFKIDLHGNLGTHAGMVVRSSAMGDDVYGAFDGALEKLAKQLRRYKRKISNHHKLKPDGAARDFVRGKKYVLSADYGEKEEAEPAGVVIAEKPEEIETMTVSEAVMQMDLRDLPALMFYNASHGRLNVVYRRVDGNISWVDPEGAKAA
jgi:ribosomal subunit interface protein